MAREKAHVEIELSNGKKAGETINELTRSSIKLNREIKDLKPGTDEYIKKTEDYKKVNGRLNEVRGELRGIKKENSSLISQFQQFLPFNSQFSTFGNTIGGVKTGVGGLTKGFGVLKGAIIATGIGAFVVLLGSLFSWLTKTQRGMELMDKATAAVSATFDVIIDRGSMLIDALKLIIDGDFNEGFEKLKDTFTGVGEEIARESKLAWDLEEAFTALEKKENDLILTSERRRKEIQELIFLTRQEEVAFSKRMEALKQANELELANMNDSLELQRERVRLMQEEFDRGESLEEDRKKLIEAQAQLEQMEAQSLSRQRELLNRMNELQNKWNAANLKTDQSATAFHNQRIKEIKEELKEADEAFDALGEKAHEKATDRHKMELDFSKRSTKLEEEKTARVIQSMEDEAAMREQKMMGSLAVTSNVMGAMSSLFEQGSEEYKVFAIFEAGINTVAAAIAAYKSTAQIAVVGPALAPIAAATAAAWGFANVRKIAAMKPGQSGVGGASISGGTRTLDRPAISSASIVSPTNPLAPVADNQTGFQQQQPINVNVGQQPVVAAINNLTEKLESGAIKTQNNLQEVDVGLRKLHQLDEERRF